LKKNGISRIEACCLLKSAQSFFGFTLTSYAVLAPEPDRPGNLAEILCLPKLQRFSYDSIPKRYLRTTGFLKV